MGVHQDARSKVRQANRELNLVQHQTHILSNLRLAPLVSDLVAGAWLSWRFEHIVGPTFGHSWLIARLPCGPQRSECCKAKSYPLQILTSHEAQLCPC